MVIGQSSDFNGILSFDRDGYFGALAVATLDDWFVLDGPLNSCAGSASDSCHRLTQGKVPVSQKHMLG